MDFLDSFLLLKDNPLLMSLAIILATFILENSDHQGVESVPKANVIKGDQMTNK